MNAGGELEGGIAGDDGGDEGDVWSSAHGGLPEVTVRAAAVAVTGLTALARDLTRPNVEHVWTRDDRSSLHHDTRVQRENDD